MPTDGVFQEGPFQQAARRVRVQAARQQVEPHVLVQRAGGGAVAGAHFVGVDLQLRTQVDLARCTVEQALQRLVEADAAGSLPATSTRLRQAIRARSRAMARSTWSLVVSGAT